MKEKLQEWIDEGRRDALRFLTGAGAFALTLVHSGILKALELPRGTKWAEGVRRMKESALRDKNEHLAVFLGRKEDGEWIYTKEGRTFTIHAPLAETARMIFETKDHNSIKRGMVSDHTHTRHGILPYLQREIAKVKSVKGSQVRQAFTFFSAPSSSDLLTSSRCLISKYFGMAGIASAPFESGVVAPEGRWQMNKIEWNEKNRATYPRLYQKHLVEEKQYLQIERELRAILVQNPEAVAEAYDRDLKQNWDPVVHSESDKTEALITSLMNRALNISRLKLTEIFEKPEHHALMERLLGIFHIKEAIAVEERYDEIAAQLLQGEIDLNRAIADFSAVVLSKLGLVVTYTPHR